MGLPANTRALEACPIPLYKITKIGVLILVGVAENHASFKYFLQGVERVVF
jgi:hypothetical protein